MAAPAIISIQRLSNPRAWTLGHPIARLGRHRLDAPRLGVAVVGLERGELDVALRTDRKLGGLALMSGTLIAEHEWTPLFAARKDLAVMQSHGTGDPMLPFASAERLRDLMTGAGLAVEWVPFRGGHEIPPSVVDQLGALVRRVV